jgi:DNA-binding HxlR family transcriptional regulator
MAACQGHAPWREVPPDGLALVVRLFRRRCAVPLLAELHAAGGGAKLVTLLARIGAGREAVRGALDEMIGAGWVARNDGIGNPFRPEYLLTESGARLADCAAPFLLAVRRLDVEPLALRRWTMPVTLALSEAPHRFSELRHALGPVTPRALTLSLKDMRDAALVARAVIDDYPPVTSYRLERRARPIVAALHPLAAAV